VTAPLRDGQFAAGEYPGRFRPVDRHDRLGAIGAARRGPNARLSDDAVRDMVVRRARAAHLPTPRGGRFYSAHSTRAGFATQAAANGAHERDIMIQGRWKSLQVARGYIRRGSVFTDNAAGKLGL
jgi:integrase